MGFSFNLFVSLFTTKHRAWTYILVGICNLLWKKGASLWIMSTTNGLYTRNMVYRKCYPIKILLSTI